MIKMIITIESGEGEGAKACFEAENVEFREEGLYMEGVLSDGFWQFMSDAIDWYEQCTEGVQDVKVYDRPSDNGQSLEASAGFKTVKGIQARAQELESTHYRIFTDPRADSCFWLKNEHGKTVMAVDFFFGYSVDISN